VAATRQQQQQQQQQRQARDRLQVWLRCLSICALCIVMVCLFTLCMALLYSLVLPCVMRRLWVLPLGVYVSYFHLAFIVLTYLLF
jgi:Flp pilus assembly protein TadB